MFRLITLSRLGWPVTCIEFEVSGADPDGLRAALASALGRTAVPGGASYCASKYAVVGLTEALRAELAATNVELHLVLPGFVDTEMSSGLQGLRGMRRSSPAVVGAAIADALQSGRGTVWVPAVLGPLVSLQSLTPRPLVTLISRLLGSGRLLTQPDALERAAYEARIASPTDRAAVDPALTVANAAASVADAVPGDVVIGVSASGSAAFVQGALAAARALAKHTKLSAKDVAQEAMRIASEICIFTNANFSIEEL